MFIVNRTHSTVTPQIERPPSFFQCPSTLFAVCPQGNDYLNQRSPEFLREVLEKEGINLEKASGMEKLKEWVKEYISLDVANNPRTAAFLKKEKSIEKKILDSLISTLADFIDFNDLELTLEWTDYL